MNQRVIVRVGRNAIVEKVGKSKIEYIVALGYDTESETWEHGIYFTSWTKEENEVFQMLYEAVKCFEKYMD